MCKNMLGYEFKRNLGHLQVKIKGTYVVGWLRVTEAAILAHRSILEKATVKS